MCPAGLPQGKGGGSVQPQPSSRGQHLILWFHTRIPRLICLIRRPMETIRIFRPAGAYRCRTNFYNSRPYLKKNRAQMLINQKWNRIGSDALPPGNINFNRVGFRLFYRPVTAYTSVLVESCSVLFSIHLMAEAGPRFHLINRLNFSQVMW